MSFTYRAMPSGWASKLRQGRHGDGGEQDAPVHGQVAQVQPGQPHVEEHKPGPRRKSRRQTSVFLTAARAVGSALGTARRDIKEMPTPASTTKVAAARPSRKPSTSASQVGPLRSAAMTSEKWTTTMPRMAKARARS
jgi:hypothetical protein